jgi:phage/plasmid-like protein (TIGR03299 family)
MSANVETMMYVREKPWHGLGTVVAEAPASSDALRFAGLDWKVLQEPVFNSRGGIIKGYKANVRDSDASVLGIVGDRYKVVQNADAFSFTDDLIGGDVRYETAGSLREGKQIWLLAKMPERRIAGDEVEPYLCFTNSHDGSSGVKVCMTPIRVVCNNTLNLALTSAKRIWSLRHTENVHERLDEARDCLFRADEYMNCLAEYADSAAGKLLGDYEIKAILNELFPVTEQTTEREKANINKCKDEFWVCYFAPDILKFRGTAWGAINAMSDMVTHSMPHRNTKNYAENNWGRIMDGHALIDRMAKLCMAGAAA